MIQKLENQVSEQIADIKVLQNDKQDLQEII
jgi:hypothetical protein